MVVTFQEDRRGLGTKLRLIQYTLVVLFVVLTAAFWYLQVAQGAKYREMAENNHQRVLSLRAPRGVMFDRNGRVLVENRLSFQISILREQTRDLARTIRTVAAVLGMDESDLRARVQRHLSEPKYRPTVILDDANLAQVARIAAHKFELPEIIVEEVPTRSYPRDDVAAHLFGYTGEISEDQLDEQMFAGAHAGSIVGKTGVEQVYNALLTGTDGTRKVMVNSVGREIRRLSEEPPTEGHRVQLTIDYDMQQAAEEAFRARGKAGTAVVLDPRSGEILIYVSTPSFDPNAFAVRVDRATWRQLNEDEEKPLMNRAIQGRYPPGSVFKLVLATAALEEGLITPDFKVHCPGSATFYGRTFKCWKKGGHGTVDLEHAIIQSCNVYFYTVGKMLEISRIAKYAHLLGLGTKSQIDLPNEIEGIVPSPEWKKRTRGEKWYAGETISVSIGQGQVSVTPVSMAVMAATLANGRTAYQPHLIRAVDENGRWKPYLQPQVLERTDLKPETVKFIHQAMWGVVNAYGTAGKARIPGEDVCGKTGTAQAISGEGYKAAKGKTEKNLEDHAWFIFFAPRDKPEIAGCLFVEHGGHGGDAAAPIAKAIMDVYFAKKQGRPLSDVRTASLLSH